MNHQVLHSSADIDPVAIETFINVVYAGLDGFTAIRLISERGTPSSPPRSVYPSLASICGELSDAVRSAASSGRGIFALPATVAKPGSARAADIVSSRVVVVDLDSGDIDGKRLHLEQHLGTPTLTVASGGMTAEGQSKLHLYWRLSEPALAADLKVLADARREVAGKVGGDPSFSSIHQLIRVPGSIHAKNGVRTGVRIRTAPLAEYELPSLLNAIHNMPALPGCGLVVFRRGIRTPFQG